jgi:hypothetical protein
LACCAACWLISRNWRSGGISSPGRWQACEQLGGAFQAQAIEGNFQAFGGVGWLGLGMAGLAHHAQHQGGLSCISSAISRSERRLSRMALTTWSWLSSARQAHIEQLYPGL